MKHFITFIATFTAIFSINISQAQTKQQSNLLSGIRSFAQTESEQFEYYYNSSNRLDSIIQRQASNHFNMKTVLTYNNEGKISDLEELYLYKGNWDKNSKYEYTYDSKGHMILKIKLVNSGGEYVENSRYKYNYNADGRIESLFSKIPGQEALILYKYDDKGRCTNIVKKDTTSTTPTVIEEIQYTYNGDSDYQIDQKKIFSYNPLDKKMKLDHYDKYTYSDKGGLKLIERYLESSKKPMISQVIEEDENTIRVDSLSGVTPESYLPDYEGSKFVRIKTSIYHGSVGDDTIDQLISRSTFEYKNPDSATKITKGEGMTIKVNGNQVIILSDVPNQNYQIFNTKGEYIQNGIANKEESITLSDGIYIIKCGDSTAKIRISR
ncbi:hypothetical protein [Falsiporphyromonas endometrii]|uniref:T9SS C-terminal target domain-containing protein n=1 Tax=Falsiporphyromonas endometrii TaxID=1387297 RepID=A0ABV9K5C6_9PORP